MYKTGLGEESDMNEMKRSPVLALLAAAMSLVFLRPTILLVLALLAAAMLVGVGGHGLGGGGLAAHAAVRMGANTAAGNSITSSGTSNDGINHSNTAGRWAPTNQSVAMGEPLATIKVDKTGASLRTGPGSSNKIINAIPGGLHVDVYGCLADRSWCEIVFGGIQYGWVRGGDLESADMAAHAGTIPTLAWEKTH